MSSTKKVLSLAVQVTPALFVLAAGIASAQAVGGAAPGTQAIDSINAFIHAWGVKLTLTGIFLVAGAVVFERHSEGVMHGVATGVTRVAIAGTLFTSGATLMNFFGIV